MNTHGFINKSISIHGDKYDYAKVNYVNAHVKVLIKCKKCGNEFWQTPNSHLSGCGCKKCANANNSERFRKTTFNFITQSRKIHGLLYDYSDVEYINKNTKVKIKCNKCGNIFYQNPDSHLAGRGCPKCKMSHLEERINKALAANKIKFIYQYRNNWLGLQSLDFFLPEYNIAIECQGEQHFIPKSKFGGIEGFRKIQERDGRKIDKCKANNVKILYFSNRKYGQYNLITKEKELIKLIKQIQRR